MTPENLIQAFSTAIAKAEGFYVEGSVPQRANNPGDLTDDGDVGCGVIDTSGPMGAKITVYPNVEAGWAALNKKVARMLNGASTVYPLDLTIMEVGIKYAGSLEWAANVGASLGVDPRVTTLAQYVAEGMTNHDNVQQATEEG